MSASTVRHQKFTFREKAKQAQAYLGLYQLALEGRAADDALLDLPPRATMIDERYHTTVKEGKKVFDTYFESLSPLRLRSLPAKEKKKLVVLTRIADAFDPDRRFTEAEVNELLCAIHEDFATLRRYLIEYGFLRRTRDCREYWRG